MHAAHFSSRRVEYSWVSPETWSASKAFQLGDVSGRPGFHSVRMRTIIACA